MVKRYCVCQFHVMLDEVLIVKVTVLPVPDAGTLPVPLQPVTTYCTPVLPETGELTDSMIEEPALSHPVAGVGLSRAEVTVRKY